MKKELEQEKQETKKVEEIYLKERRDEMILNEKFFYPKQTNKMPKYRAPGEKTEQDEAKEAMMEEIKRQKAEILTDEEYEKLIDDCKQRDMPTIAIFRASKQSVTSLSTVMNVHRFTCLILAVHVPFWLSPKVWMAGLATNLYGGTLGSGVLCLAMRVFKQKLARDFVLRIEFDVHSEKFKVIMPPQNFLAMGNPDTLTVEPENFKMLSVDK